MKRQVVQLLLGGLSGKIFSVLRELVLAALFGAATIASSFRLAQSAFLIPIQGFASEALNAGFIPMQARLLRENPAAARAAVHSMHWVLGVAAVVGTGLLLGLAPQWVRTLAPGFGPEAQALATSMVRVMALALPAYLWGSLHAAALHAAGQSAYMAARASALSMGVVTGTLLAWWLDHGLWLAVAFTATQWLLAVWGAALLRMHMQTLPQSSHTLGQHLRQLQPVGHALLSLLWIPVVMQLHYTIERRVASSLIGDSMAALDYARFVTDTAVLLMAMPVGMAGLASMPNMSAEQMRHTVGKTFNALLMIGVPLSALAAANATLVVQCLFQRGAFDAKAVSLTSTLLTAAAWGLGAQLIAYAGLKFLSARGYNRQALLITCAGVGTNIALNLWGGQLWGVATLGWASSANAALTAAAVVWALNAWAPCRRTMGVLSLACVAPLVQCWYWPDLDGWRRLALHVPYWLAVLMAWPASRQLLMSLARRHTH
jgi:putative peptidoglycan lipid II flippase